MISLRQFATLTVVTVLAATSAIAHPALLATRGENNLNMHKMLDLINHERTQNGVPAVSYEPRLTQDANHHSGYQSRVGTMTHNDSNGNTLSRLVEAGIDAVACGENVAYNQSDEDEVMVAWMNSPGHRENILNPDYTHVGVSHINGYWTQVFATLKGGSQGSSSYSPGGSTSTSEADMGSPKPFLGLPLTNDLWSTVTNNYRRSPSEPQQRF
ncbi:hypothetical protein IWQ60_000103 [Tieghemiomyces parasiticus]|uniref:SCP domain-containing protein n=1 Tax=Tieghemiomyces parasiticus TaxID=78921 RepID=A0A9W8AFI4_9FUNG|nr:hypothetical protein IWQ60_000103 [Tieghemiomyces parasiticus]